MIELPDPEKSFEYENDFYLSCGANRIAKFLAHYELFKLVSNIPGAIVECGVFKGISLARFAMLRSLFSDHSSKKIIGFDIYGKFPRTSFEADKEPRQKFIDSAGEESISKQQLTDVLRNKGVDDNVELVEGDITETIPKYISTHPELKISLLNLDTDIYEPSKTVLEFLFPKIVPGGILILDDYGTFPGETKAVDDFFRGMSIKIKKFPFSNTPCYIVKQ